MIPDLPHSPSAWPERWTQLARAAGIDPAEKLLLALSGGADSVLLAHLVAAAGERPNVRAVHVDHGLRGAESRADARFCQNLCRALGLPFTRREAALDPGAGSLEAKAREARYALLSEEARRTGHLTLITGHHSDDALETVLMRFVRGTDVEGLRGPRARMLLGRVPAVGLSPVPAPGDTTPVRVVRPLLTLRREEVRRLLRDRGLGWREDSSNADARFTRNRARNGFLPKLERLCGTHGVENLRAFGQAVERLEEGLAGATAHLAWTPAPHAAASRSARARRLGGVLPRAGLMALASPLRRRALWRLLTEGSGRAPGQRLLDTLLQDLAAARCTRHSLPGDWTLILRASELQLVPPRALRTATASPEATTTTNQLALPFPTPEAGLADEPLLLRLPVPGIVSLADGRRISAEVLNAAPDRPVPRSGLEAELDAEDLPAELCVRLPRRGDRFRGLGAPGSRALTRVLADRGIPREERDELPLVADGGEILWVAGVGPSERHRVRERTRRRLRLTLHADLVEAGPPPEGPEIAALEALFDA